ncbi:glycoside hydrolase domain-containing protein [Streptomyces sp. NPDC005149]
MTRRRHLRSAAHRSTSSRPDPGLRQCCPTSKPRGDLGFAQGTSATYTWMVPQDVQGLAEAMGGRDRAAERLDAFFHKADGSWSVKGGDALRYDPTNEPGIQAPWLYNAPGSAVEDAGDGTSDPRHGVRYGPRLPARQ